MTKIDITTPPYLFWTDIETTGLDERINVMLELGVVVTTTDLEEIASFSRVIADHGARKWCKEFSPKVYEMHTKNGLFDECESPNALLGVRLVQETLEFLGQYAPAGVVPMCGSTIDFDRRFISSGYPEIAKHFHYRSINVSSFREVAKLWKPEVYTSLPTKKDNQESNHRVISDCRDSIAQLRHYRQYLLNLATEEQLLHTLPEGHPLRR